MHCWQSNAKYSPAVPVPPRIVTVCPQTTAALYSRGLPVSSPKSPLLREKGVCGARQQNESLLSALCPGTPLAQSGSSEADSSHLLLRGEHASRDFSPPPRSSGSSPYFPSRLTCTSSAILGHCLKLGRRCPLPLEDESRETHPQPGFFLSGFISPLYCPGYS